MIMIQMDIVKTKTRSILLFSSCCYCVCLLYIPSNSILTLTTSLKMNQHYPIQIVKIHCISFPMHGYNLQQAQYQKVNRSSDYATNLWLSVFLLYSLS